MAMRTAPSAAPTIIVQGEADGFTMGQKLSTWDEIHRYYAASIDERNVTVDAVKQAFKEFPADDDDGVDEEVQRVEWLELQCPKKDNATAKDLAAPKAVSASYSSIRAQYQELGSKLDEQANKNFNHYTGKAKEDYDGSAVVIARDLERNNEAQDGKLFADLFAYKPGSMPSTAEKKDHTRHPDAIPVHLTNKYNPDAYPAKSKSGRGATWAWRTHDFCDGTSYGKSLINDRSLWKDYLAWSGSDGKEVAKPSDAAVADFFERWAVEKPPKSIVPRVCQAWHDRVQTRINTLYSRMELAIRFLQRQQDIKEYPGPGQLEWYWTHVHDKSLQAASKKPVYLTYKYTTSEGANAEDATSRGGMSVATLCNYDWDAALDAHKPGESFLGALKDTLSREKAEGPKEYKLNLSDPSDENVYDMALSLYEFLDDDDNAKNYLAWLRDKERDVRIPAFTKAAKKIHRFYSTYLEQEANRIATAELKAERERQQVEAEQMTKGHSEAA